jgi:hypothetical protein
VKKEKMKNEDKGKNRGKLKYIGVVVVLVFLAGIYLASATTVITDIQMTLGNVTIREDEIQVGSNITIGKGGMETCRLICDKANTASDSRINFFIDGDAANNMKMTILHNGNVGIGKKSPGENLDVGGLIHSDGGMRTGGVAGGLAYWRSDVSNRNHEILCHNCYWEPEGECGNYRYMMNHGSFGARMIAFQYEPACPDAPGDPSGKKGGIHFYVNSSKTVKDDPIIWDPPQFSILPSKVNVNDTMRLRPRTAAPANPQPGDMYFHENYNGVNQGMLRVYDGDEWKNCW